VHTLRLGQRLKPGTYTLYWLGRSSDGATFRTSHKIRVITAAAKAHTAVPAQIILTVSESTKTARRAVQSAGQTIEATPEQSFDVASTRDASVVIVDADKYGVKLVHDLQVVFPTTAIVALSESKVTLAILARQGAIALPSSTPAAKIAALVRKLAKR
jgi:methionine-rich copper-binding protein CopC